MSEPIIRVENLSKRYALNHQGAERYTAMRDVLAQGARRLFRRHDGEARGRSTREDFWALRDVNFEVRQGEVLGIIGRNGAGKSTLLKILSRITEPTEGRVKIKGRVASLLEVGTGFHPELTGRENIYLNGAILGMSRVEIKARFDEIVDFAEVEKFLDTPVKRYSSGMYVRLAFAVAAHLEPEVLIVDEVLSVGDAEFQTKCLKKIESVAEGDRTILFVSHNMAAIRNLTKRSLVLRRGRLTFGGETGAAVEHYLGNGEQEDDERNINQHRPSWALPYIISVQVLNYEGIPVERIPLGGDVLIEMRFNAGIKQIKRPVMGVVIHNSVLGTVAGVNTRMTNYESNWNCQAGVFRCQLGQLPFLQGRYIVDVWLGDGASDVDTVSGYTSFEIEDADVYGSGKLPFKNLGSVFLKPIWHLEQLQ